MCFTFFGYVLGNVKIEMLLWFLLSTVFVVWVATRFKQPQA